MAFVLVLERDFRRNEQKAAKVGKKNGCQTFTIFAAFCFNFSSMVEFEDEDQNMVSEKMSDMFILKRPRVENSVTNEGETTMSEFLYIYRGRESDSSPEQMQQTLQKWMAWLKELKENGHLKDPGHPLESNSKFVKGKRKTIVDGPFVEAKDLVCGYTLIEAHDLKQAAELAKGCPILEFEGEVEVRPILQL